MVAEDEAWVEGQSLIDKTVEDVELIDPDLSPASGCCIAVSLTRVPLVRPLPAAPQCSCSRDAVSSC